MRQELRSERTGKILFAACWLVYMCSYIGRMNYSAALVSMIQEGVFNKAQSGMIGTVFFVSYGVGQLLASYLGNRVSSFKLVGAGVFASALSNAMMYIGSSSYSVMLFFWGLNGLANSLFWSPIFYIISYILPRKQRKKACVLIATGASVGSIVAYLVSTVILENFHYMAVFLIPSFILLGIGIMWVVTSIHTKRVLHKEAAEPVCKRTEDSYEGLTKGAPTETGYYMNFFPLLIASGVIFMIPAIIVQGVLNGGVGTWVPAIISEVYDVTPTVALLLSILIPIANVVGVYVGTYMSDRLFKDEMKSLIAMCAFTALPLAVLCFIGRLPVVLCVALLGVTTILMVGVNQVGISLVPLRLAPFGQAAAFTGFLNAMSYVGTAISNYGFGALAEAFGWNITISLWIPLALLAMVSCMVTRWRWKPFFKKMEEEA